MLPTIPGGMEWAVILLILIALGLPAWYTRRVVLARGSDHGLAWGTFAVLSMILGKGIGGVVFAMFYLQVRDDIGEKENNG